MDFLINTFAFVFALGVIIFVHEAGHFLMAKIFDVRVLTFSLGFGRRIWGFQRGETEYRVAWIPLGGYVRLGGESPEEATGDPRDFQAKPRWQRIAVYLAGPAMNVVLAVLLIAGLFVGGYEVPFVQDIPPVVGTVMEGGAADEAGLRSGDRILSIGGKEAESWQDVWMTVMESPGEELSLRFERGGRSREVVLVPRKATKYEFGDAGFYPRLLPRIAAIESESPAQEAGFRPGDQVRSVDGRPMTSMREFVEYVQGHPGDPIQVSVRREGAFRELTVVPADEGGVGRIGVRLSISREYGPVEAFRQSLRYNWNVTVQTVALVGKLVTREVQAKRTLHGPIEIAALSGEAARRGLPDLLHLMGLVSISIAILNLLPIPVLDGGQITILLVESTLRRDLPLRLKEVVTIVGLVLVMLLMVAVIAFDLARNWPFAGDPGPGAASSAPESP
ncbi:MAG: RIP metalloprotease RseP [Thermoanaerobaculia bacterium]|nr:RIP metalloprotease RseP [Thermoanaerobaculia bacterium]